MVVTIQIDISTSLIFEINSNNFPYEYNEIIFPFTFKQQVKTMIKPQKTEYFKWLNTRDNKTKIGTYTHNGHEGVRQNDVHGESGN